MAAIRTRYGKLCVDFRYLSIRCRETTALEDNAQNRKKLEKAIERTKKQMMEAAKNLDFLEAAQFRDELIKLEDLLKAKV